MHFRNFLNSVKNNNTKEVKSYLKNKDLDPTYLDNIALESSIIHNAPDVFKILISDNRFDLSAKDNTALFHSIHNSNLIYFDLLISKHSVIHSISKEWIFENFNHFKDKSHLKEKLLKIIHIENF